MNPTDKQTRALPEPNPFLDFRTKNRMTQEDLARKLNVATRTIWDWEHGRKPSRLARARVKSLLGLTV